MTPDTTDKRLVLFVCLGLLLAFAAGRWTGPEKIKTVVQTVTVEKKTDDQTKKEQDHKKYTTVEVVSPDGTKTRTTTITDDRGITSTDKSTDNTDITQTKSKEVDKSSSKLTMQFLAGMAITAPGVPIYGLSVSRNILGPVVVGVFGLTNKTGGFSIGLSF
jgi:hypothetical protein